MRTKLPLFTLLMCLCLLLQSQVSIKKQDQELNQAIQTQNEAKAVQDQVIADDLIVQFSLCVGVDCVNGENFGADTFRMKENNLRIHADDTSNSSSFPNNDWRLVFNDQSNGGANKFTIEDATAGRSIMTIEAGGPNNSLYVDNAGNIGRKTSNPALDFHTVNGNTPGIRLEQDGSSGFTPQTWDLAGNEANFFVRDVTNGSKLPFRIFPNSPDKAFEIAPGGVTIKNVSLIQPSSPSDARLKDRVVSLEDATKVLQQLYPKSFFYSKRAVKEFGFPSDEQLGLIAQDVEKVLPNLINEIRFEDVNESYKTVEYESLISLLIQGFKEQQALIESQEAKIKKLESEVAAYASLEDRIMQLEASVSKSKNAK
ncbi:tail fiber domain-containing protein [Marinilongibacter aquaticus]|uniref:tail fiber domain-containing protein n=1 Tax=Marinilongibacter aquaticus TaxID=2975157 RepID=UPI0021BD8001|nr:tail fiber domain-containing protein [Marinilongibacter aquaticus]UBM60841.1 tail fiber domain-containing protein [Marinilongibacter aquaticus]